MKDTIPNENFVAYNIFTFDGFISNSTDGFISLSQKTLPWDNFRRFGHFSLLLNAYYCSLKKCIRKRSARLETVCVLMSMSNIKKCYSKRLNCPHTKIKYG